MRQRPLKGHAKGASASGKRAHTHTVAVVHARAYSLRVRERGESDSFSLASLPLLHASHAFDEDGVGRCTVVLSL